jgi:xanthosine utilization system XapX-like protein
MKAVLTAIIAGVLVAIIYAIFGTIALLFGA